MRVRFIIFALIVTAVVLAAGRVSLDPIQAQTASGHQLFVPVQAGQSAAAADEANSLAESGPPFVVTDAEGRQVRPDVAGHPELNDCQNLVVWWDETAKQIWGKFVEREWRGESFLISGEMSADGPAKVAYSIPRHRWLVVWSSATDAGTNAIRGRYVECGGMEGAVFTIGREAGDGPAHDDEPAVAAHGEQYAVTWRRARDGGLHQIVGAHVSGFNTLQFKELSDEGAVAEPAIGCAGVHGACLVAWTRGEGEGDGRDVVGRYWFAREGLVGEQLLVIAATARVERYPSVAWNGWYDRWAYAVTWTDEGGEANGDYNTVRARTVYPTGTSQLDNYVVGEGAITVSLERQHADHGDVAALGPDFVVVWSGGGAPHQDIFARRVHYNPETRALDNRDHVLVAAHDAVEIYPAVAPAGDPLALAVWQIEREGGGSDILGRHVAVGTHHEAERVALVGVLAPETYGLHAGGSWNVVVKRVLRGQFSCPTATVRFDDASAVDPALQAGDMVSVNADPLPAAGVCALTVGAPGTYIERSPNSQIYLPILE